MIRCLVRGKLKNYGHSILVGDRVEFEVDDSGQGVVCGILPRESELRRPLVANVNQLIVVVSARAPEPDWTFLSRQLTLATSRQLSAVICLNKIDLVTPTELTEIKKILSGFPYPAYFISVLKREGIFNLEAVFKDRVTAISGSSGVGKSSLINAIQPGLNLQTGQVSDKKQSGKHTTRRVELLFLENGGMVFDTPGFHKLEIAVLGYEYLDDCFPEMKNFRANCRFRNCLHRDEPGCTVRMAVEAGVISSLRYGHYLIILKDWLQANRKGV